jgi:K+-sensing histidine kinase KdpD
VIKHVNKWINCEDNLLTNLEAQDLEEVLGNLIDNACKWANETIQVQCFSTGSRVWMKICDDGPGIAASESERVF